MKAFEQGINKQDFLKEIYKHQEMDSFIKGTYGQDHERHEQFKACSIGCSLESVSRLKGIKLNFGSHIEMQNHLGIPEWFARLQDKLFENLPMSRAKKWTSELTESINEGSDLNKIKVPYICFILEQNLITLDSLKVDKKYVDVIKAIADSREANMMMIDAQKSGDEKEIARAARAAGAAEWAEWAAGAAEWAARAAEWAARAAGAAEWAAEWAARAAGAAARAAGAAGAAESKTYEKFADKLLELVRDCR